MKLGSFLSLFLIASFLFVAIMRLHPVGEPLGNKNVFKDRSPKVTDLKNIDTMDDYYLRNGQRETGSNNIVASVVFDYRAFDTLGEATVLFLVVSSISMLLFKITRRKEILKNVPPRPQRKIDDISRIISYGSLLLFPIIIVFGIYLVVHGHISPGGGFQGGAVMASGTALLLASAHLAKDLQKKKQIFSFFESVGLTIFIAMGFAGIGATFLMNFLANRPDSFLGKTIELGSNPGILNSAGVLPILSLAIGIEVFFGLSIILVTMYDLSRDDEEKKEAQTNE
jgi:multisubunit Na+/H+ antiporter MnhB subunit